jgi:Raf kinase inhibitor-like YbhB/YbcL family protein
MEITNPSFGHEKEIPTKYTCDGENINPPLYISNVPPAARSLALIIEDIDAKDGTFTHWVVYNIPVAIEVIHENIIPGTPGTNDYNTPAYRGPCPPFGEKHRYVFRLYALDSLIDLPPGRPQENLERMIEGHILEVAEITGLYERV